MRHTIRRLTILAGLAAMLTAILAGCGTTAASVPPDPFAGVAHSAVGASVRLGTTWTATVSGVTLNSGQGQDQPAGGDTYLVVALAFTNTTTASQTLYTITPLILRDAAGQRYTQVTVGFATPPDGPVAAGATAAGAVVFMVPQTQTAFLLAYSTGNAADGHAIWDLTAPAS